MVALSERPSEAPLPAVPTRLRTILAWGVHAYTALGLVAAAIIAVLIVRGGADSFRCAFVVMLVAVLIDSTDGVLARAVRVKEVLPEFDGRKLDDITDFVNYTALPLLLVWRAEILPAGQEAWLLAPLLASAYGFCQVAAKTDDGFFLGFPSYWNVVAFYLYAIHRCVAPLPGWFSIGLLAGLALLTFVPTRYLYPSLGGALGRSTTVLGGLWMGLLGWILWRLPVAPADDPGRAGGWLAGLILVSLLFPVYYMLASWVMSWRRSL